MIRNIEGITNGNVLVVYDHYDKTVTVNDNFRGVYKAFAGFAGMWELYNDFKEAFTDEIDYQTTLLFFNPDLINQDGYKDKI